MRLEITRRSDLAARALLELARTGQRLRSAELADRVGTTSGFLSQAMTPLVGRGWVASTPGRHGGYLLMADPDAISLLDVIEAVEGPTDRGECVLEDRPCGRAAQCALHQPWSRAREQLTTELSRSTLASLGAGA